MKVEDIKEGMIVHHVLNREKIVVLKVEIKGYNEFRSKQYLGRYASKEGIYMQTWFHPIELVETRPDIVVITEEGLRSMEVTGGPSGIIPYEKL